MGWWDFQQKVDVSSQITVNYVSRQYCYVTLLNIVKDHIKDRVSLRFN